MSINPLLNSLGHTSNNIIILQIFLHRHSIELRNLTLKRNLINSVYIFFTTICNHKFFKAHGEHFEPLNLANRKRSSLPSQGNSKQRTCRNNMKFWKIFAEIFKRLYCTGTVLNFIKHKQSLSGNNFFPEYNTAKFF